MGLLQWAMMALMISLAAGALAYNSSVDSTATRAQTMLKVLFGTCLAISVTLLILIVLGVTVTA